MIKNFPWQKIFPSPKNSHNQNHMPKTTCPKKNSHDQNHMSKIFMPKITCPKNFQWLKPHDQKFPMTKKNFPWPKSHVQKILMHPKKVNVPQTKKKKKKKKINAPPNFTTTKIFDMSIHNYQNFPITMPSKKIPAWPCPCTTTKIPTYPKL